MGKHKIWDSLDRDCIQAIGCPILGCSSFVEKQQFRTIDLKLPSFESPNTLLRLGAYSNAESTGGVSIGNGIIPPPPRQRSDPGTMLLVSARKGPSSIHGIGLIAAEQISAGTEVWRFMPGFDVVVPETRLPTLSPNARQQLIYYAYFHTRTRTYVLSGDDDRFTNHSAEPNTEAAGYYTVARRDIAAGEEITVNYDSMSALAWWATDTDTSSCELVSERRP